MLQQRWTDTYGPDATGEFAGRSYWLCTENWPNQNYAKDLSVYYESGGFSNGYVPLFVIVGFQNKVYWDNNSSGFEAALQQAINDIPTEGVFVQNGVTDKTFLFGVQNQFDVSNVFKDFNDNPVIVTVESNTTSSVATVTITDNTMTVTANGSVEGTTEITLKGTAGEFSDTDTFTIKVYDPANYNIEDFETGMLTNIPWTFAEEAGWSISTISPHEGIYCVKSNPITDSQQAEILVEVEYPIGGKIRFAAKASSEPIYDNLKFYIDRYEKKKISGQTSWQDVEFAVDPGVHILKWSYQKDTSTSANSDCAWIDYIVFEGGRVTGIQNMIEPEGIELYQNYPNPFNPSTKISFSLTETSEIKLSVFNQKGEIVKTIHDGKLDKGNHNFDFNGSELTSGIYFYKLETEKGTSMKKMIMLK